MWVWVIVGFLALAVFVLLIKIHLLQKSAKEIEIAFVNRLETQTNTLIDISSRDKHMRKLANVINEQLRKLRESRHTFLQGDAELKNAITNISHDLRTPLTAISGYLDLLEKEEDTANIRRYVAVIKNRTQMLTGLTEELFNYSVLITSQKEEKPKTVIINNILEESIVACYTALKERGIVPKIEITTQKVIRSLDASALSRVFANLISNAIKYSEGDLAITLTKEGEISFSNKAQGLDKVQIGKLFNRFYTLQSAKKGAGLGLAISKTLMERLGGAIWAEYENNRLSIWVRV